MHYYSLENPSWLRFRPKPLNFSLNIAQSKSLIDSTTVKNPRKRYKSTISRPQQDSSHENTEFIAKCNNLWKKFDERISPILKKYKFSPQTKNLAQNLSQFSKYKENPPRKRLNKLRRSINPISSFDIQADEVTVQEVQCDLASDVSETDTKLKEPKYLHYITISY
jgi:hypothetical protein